MRSIARVTRGAALAVAVLLFAPAVVSAQDSKSAVLVKELVQLLDQQKQMYAAAKLDDQKGHYVAALYIPNVQLLVISALYKEAAYMDDRLNRRMHQDVYIDLNAAAAVLITSRVLVEDLRADGLFLRRDNEQAFDGFEIDGKRTVFDGEWRKQKLASEKEYLDLFGKADQNYAKFLSALIAEARKGS